MKKHKIDYENIPVFSIKRIFLSIVRYFYFIFIAGVISTVIGGTLITLNSSSEYQSTGYIAIRSNVNATVFATISEVVKSDAVANASALHLRSLNIYHSDKTEISPIEIKNGISTTSSNSSLRIKLTYRSYDEVIVKPVLDAIIEYSVSIGNDTYAAFGKNLIVSDLGTEAKRIVTNDLQNMIVCAFVGISIGIVMALIKEYYQDKIYSVNELIDLGLSPFEVKVSKTNSLIKKAVTKLDMNDNLFIKSLVDLQNNSVLFSNKGFSQIVAITTSKGDFRLVSDFATIYSTTYSNNNEKTLLIDFNFHNPTLSAKFSVISKKITTNEIDEFENFVTEINDNLYIIACDKFLYQYKIFKNDKLFSFLNEAKSNFDHIVIIVPPVLDNPDILFLKDIVDDVLLLSKKDFSRRKEIVRANNTMLDLESVLHVYIK